MKLKILQKRFISIIVSIFCDIGIAANPNPIWSITPTTSNIVSVPSNGTATVEYLVANHGKKFYNLSMLSIMGIEQVTTSGYCSTLFPLAPQASCTLRLQINGNSLQGNLHGGPIICQEGNLFLCFQPTVNDALNITLSAPVPTQSSPATITSTSNYPAVLHGINMNWLGNVPTQYHIFYCRGNGCDINSNAPFVPSGPITSTSIETDPGFWTGYSGAICPASASVYSTTNCSNIFYTP